MDYTNSLVNDFWSTPMKKRDFNFCMNFLRLAWADSEVNEGDALWDNIAIKELHEPLKTQCKLEGLL